MTAIQDKFNALLFGGLNLGNPLGDELSSPDGGSKQHFEFGSIYFHPRLGAAFECHGLILQTYLEIGEEKSGLGYPVTDEIDNPEVPGGRMSIFEAGRLVWELSSGVKEEFDEVLGLVSQVVVKLEDSISTGLGQGETLSPDQLEAILGFLTGGLLQDPVVRRLFDALSPAEIQSLIGTAQANDPGYFPPNFENFLVIECPPGFDTGSLVFALNQVEGVVEYAYTSPLLEEAAVVGTSNPRFADQGYLGIVNGINVQAAWTQGADGSGVEFIDIERGWLLTHRDLPQNIPLLDGHNFREGFPHGCAVLGIVVGIDDNKGIVGIAPKAGAAVISRVTRSGANLLVDQTAAIILKAAVLLGFGDVLLLEMTAEGRPVEIAPAIFHAIQLATACGLIVVEPAGNGGHNLDDFRDDSGKHVLSRNVPADFKDSGAIVVGASQSAFPHARLSFSSFGSRVDCYAWGENIVTTGDEVQITDQNAIMNNFRGTSGASAIIAGACVLAQDLNSRMIPVSGLSGKLGPLSMRQMLSNPQNGTPSFLESDQIGSMPDFQKIIANEYFQIL
jgi:hypothetical protein